MRVGATVLLIVLATSVLAQTDMGVKYTSVTDSFFVATFINKDEPNLEEFGITDLQISSTGFFSLSDLPAAEVEAGLQAATSKSVADHILSNLADWEDRFFRMMDATTVTQKEAIKTICTYRRDEESKNMFIYCAETTATFILSQELSATQEEAIRDNLYVSQRKVVLNGLPEAFKSARAPPKKAAVVNF